MSKKGFNTQLVHIGNEPCPLTGSLVPPIYQTSTFVFPSAEIGRDRFSGEAEGYVYTRLGNPTVNGLEEKMAALEGGEAALAFGSGMAAISAVLIGLVKSGDHILCSDGLYGCTFGLLEMLRKKFNVSSTLVDMSEMESVKNAIQPNTTVIYIETPINPTMKLVDLEMVAGISREIGAQFVVDNTFLSPYLQRPLEWGADVVVHSATKYIGGHGDVIGGIAVGTKAFMDEVRMTTLKDIGGVLGPFDAWLLTRGLKTLAVRMDRHCDNAMKVAQYLTKHPNVEQVYFPGLPGFPQWELASKQMKKPGSVISLEVKGGLAGAQKVLNRVELCRLAVSLGDVDTLIQHPATMTHAIVPTDERIKMGIGDGLIRISVGIEDVEDIISDLEQALN